MSGTDSTRLTIHKDRPTAVSSSGWGSNVDALAFNLAFIALHKPKLAVELLRLYREAHAIKADDPQAPDTAERQTLRRHFSAVR
jgi:hypothetical protein